jgi:hypothetical protein
VQIPLDLVIRIEDSSGFAVKTIVLPLEDLPPNANAACPLMLSARLEPRARALVNAALPPWGNQHA